MDKIEQIKLSIVTPSYNQGPFLEKTILSVLEQGYPNLEYIIIDGGSTDNSLDIIKKYEKHLSYWVSEKDRGQSHAINKGFERATGDLFGWLNSDDYYAPGALKTVAEVYQENPTVGAVVGAGDLVDASGKSLCAHQPFPVSLETLYLWNDRHFWQPACFFTREAWETCGPLSEKLTYSMDLDLWLNIAEKFSFATTDALLAHNLKHDNAKTTEYAVRSRVEAAFTIGAHGGEQQSRDFLISYIEGLEEQIKKNEERYRKDLGNIRNSLSWKVTALLRKFGKLFVK